MDKPPQFLQWSASAQKPNPSETLDDAFSGFFLSLRHKKWCKKPQVVCSQPEQSRENCLGTRFFEQKLQKLHMKWLLMHSMIWCRSYCSWDWRDKIILLRRAHKETKGRGARRKEGCSLPSYKRDQVLPPNSLPILSKTSNAPARSITCSNQTTETAPRCHNLLPNSSKLFQTPKKLAQKLQNSLQTTAKQPMCSLAQICQRNRHRCSKKRINPGESHLEKPRAYS